MPEPGGSKPGAPQSGAGASKPGAPVPRLPHGKGIRISGPAIVRILMFAALLLAVLALRKPCADGVSRFITQFDEPDAGVAGAVRNARHAGDAGAAAPDTSAWPAGQYIEIKGPLTDEQLKVILEKAGMAIDQDAVSPPDSAR